MLTFALFLCVDCREIRKVVWHDTEIHIGELCRELQGHTHTHTHANTHTRTHTHAHARTCDAHTNLKIFQTF